MRVFHRFVALAVLMFCSCLVQAQSRASEFQISVGQRNAILEGTCSSGSGQPTIGGSWRYHVTPRWSIGPEISYARACDRQAFTYYHPQYSGMLQVTRDLTQGERIRPYLIGGLGFVRHHSRYAPAAARLEASGGIGTKIFLTKRAFVAPEVQVSGQALKYSVGVGFVLR